jgi:hypothetical protein
MEANRSLFYHCREFAKQRQPVRGEEFAIANQVLSVAYQP